MESVKKWLSERVVKKNGLYLHYSPPKLLDVASAAQLRQWARGGAAIKLERAVLAGQGHRLLAEAEALPLSHHLPHLVAKCDALHAAVEKGSLLELQELLEGDYNRRKYVLCRDEAGVGLLHKAVFYDYMDIAEYLVKNHPQLVNEKDSEGRTPLHYAALCRDEAAAAALLEGAGAARGARDAAGRTPAHYRGHGRTLLTLPAPTDMAPEPSRNPPGLVIKRHNIRIWCHDCDMARLQRVIWEGHGTRLLSEVSNQPVVKRFLEAVPYIMNTIREIHNAVVQNDLEGLMKHAGDPVPPQILSSRDSNNMTVMHKAAGLGHGGILGYIGNRYPLGINDVDNDGRTPLHYAAAVRDDQHTFHTLISMGADEGALDNKNRPPGYYVNKPQEIDKHILKMLPEAPRTASSAYPASWDWQILDTDAIVELNKKSRRKHLRASNENISSKNNSNSISENTYTRRGMKASSTQEFIKDLPDLDDSRKRQNGNVDKEPEVVEENDTLKENDEQKDEEPPAEASTEGDHQNISKAMDNVEESNEDNDDNPEESNPENDNVKNVEEETNDEIGVDEGTAADTKDEMGIDEGNAADPKNEIGGTDEENSADVKENSADVKENSADVKENSADGKENGEDVKDGIEKHEENVEDTKDEAENNEDKENAVNINNEESIQEESTNDVVGTEKETKEEPDIDQKPQGKENESQDDRRKEDEEADTDSNTNDDGNKEIAGDPEEPRAKQDVGTNEEPKENNPDENPTHGDEENKNGNVKHEEEMTDKKESKNIEEEEDVPTNEGNNNNEHKEDDDDVQVQGDSHSEYSDIHLRSTAEAINTGSAKRGNETNGRNTQESLIEGIISSEAEQDSQDASIAQRDETVQGEILVVDSEIDPEVADLISTANMEMLATLVLNGEGSRLVGRRSRNVELQAFLDNVPSYMQKINKVHSAAREGNIRDLQAALDRRKFAIARDSISPNGATPLHVATVFGKTNIMKYLGGRFPETLSAVDFEGRTALHYAAVLPDNGHYYNMLQQLGANAKDLDDSGQSAEDYFKNPRLLPFNQLLADYGISEEAAQSMLSDKGTSDPANGHMDIPIFRTEEGRYLAKSLGDPLIKGLTEVANVKPKDPVAFLASFLHNFPAHEKSQLGTQESNVIVTKEAPEVENDQPPPEAVAAVELASLPSKVTRSAARTATRPHRPIDVVTVEPQPEASPDAPEAASSSVNRDEHGQSMLHFAAARTHTRNALFQLIQESDISVGYRDELYRTARDVSIQANVGENTVEIDKWVLHLAARGNTQKIMELLLEGYDHILDVVDDEGLIITEVVAQREDANEMSNLLASIPTFEESREALHGAVRRGDLAAVQEATSAEGGRTLARAQNSFGRTALHVAVLAQHEDVVAHLAQTCSELLRIGDNLERTPLHYAMGVEKIESLSRILIRAGAKRVLKDLKGRQPSYYFMNKSDILRLKEEEEVY